MIIKKLNRNTNQRKGLIRSLAYNLFKYESIDTTLAKARVVRPFAEKLITKAKTNDVVTRRNLLKDLPNEDIVSKLLTQIGPKVASRPGGYLRIVKLANRSGDAALLARVEFVDSIKEEKKAPKAKETTVVAEEPKKSVLETAKSLVPGTGEKIKVTKKSSAKKEKKETK